MIGHAEAVPFDVCGPLPTGVTVLEASAGTGKTYTIAALAARYVAEGTPLDQLLLVTFTRMATGELRERVRERLVNVEQGLERALAGVAPSGHDQVAQLLAEGPVADVRLRCDRLRRAIAGFDAATIATTHGFCQEVLAGLGIAGDLERDTTFVEDIGDLVDEVVDDLYVRRFHRGDTPPFRRSQAAQIARVAVQNPAAPIVPGVGPIPEMRRRLALAVRGELEQRKRRMGVMTYDDLLTRLDDALAGDRGEAAAERLRARYGIVLVDEFQDTDPVQWNIMRRAFGEGDATLVLIGDPKQAIYAFRGADVYAYLEAARAAAARATLDVNWRSDQGLIDAYDTMFGGAKLGIEGIVYRRVRAAEANQEPRLLGAPSQAPLRVRIAHRDEPSITLTRTGCAGNASAREHIARDLAADMVALLSSGAEIQRRSKAGEALSRERVRPGHVAVLVRTNRNAALIREVLDDVGIPAVINGAGSVFGTPPAREWLRILEAIERPTSPIRAHSAALTCFFGWSAAQVAAADEDAWEQVHRRLHDWARVLRLKGVASLTETITLVERLPERILATADGERWLTDLRHVGQLLHAAATTTEQMGTTALTAWLRRRIAEAEQDTSDEERSRRLESDAEAVQVLTIHRSKGLVLVALAAPTGKAAARLEEAVHEEASNLAVDERIRSQLLALQASTLHRLLGWRPDSHSRFRHNRGQRLPHDLGETRSCRTGCARNSSMFSIDTWMIGRPSSSSPPTSATWRASNTRSFTAMAETLTVEGLTFTVARSERRKTAAIVIGREGQLVLQVPRVIDRGRLQEAARSRLPWVRRKLSERLLRARLPVKEFVPGEPFWYLGRSYRLAFVPTPSLDGDGIALRNSRFEIARNQRSEAEPLLRAWYQQQGHDWLSRRVAVWTDRMAIESRQIRVRDLGYRWASYSEDGAVNFHWQAIALPPAIIDYLIVHELTHLDHPRHDRAYWRALLKLLPDAERRRDWLRSNGEGW